MQSEEWRIDTLHHSNPFLIGSEINVHLWRYQTIEYFQTVCRCSFHIRCRHNVRKWHIISFVFYFVILRLAMIKSQEPAPVNKCECTNWWIMRDDGKEGTIWFKDEWSEYVKLCSKHIVIPKALLVFDVFKFQNFSFFL